MSPRSELDHLRAIPTPRPDEVCRALGWRAEPLAGFILWGVLWNVWLTTMGFTAGMFAGVAIGNAIGSGADIIAAALGAAGASVSVFFFVRWARRKRAGSLRLVRDGKLVEANVADKADETTAQLAARVAFIATKRYPQGSWYRAQFLDGIQGFFVYLPLAKKGETAPVMFVPDYKYALAFDSEGRAIPCKLQRA
jgi:hypothetical protein